MVREGYASAAAAAGVKTLFCGDFGRRFFYLYCLFRFWRRRSKLAHLPRHLIRFATAARVKPRFQAANGRAR
jgi:hypothetical protein